MMSESKNGNADKPSAASTAKAKEQSALQKAGAAGDKLTGWALLAPGEMNRMVGGFSRTTMLWIAVALGALVLLSVNVISSKVFRTASADLTDAGLYSISKSTRRVLGNISEPIDVRIYYSNRLGEAAPVYKRYFERVRALFDEYAAMSGDKLRVSYIEPEPFSDAEDRAVAAGLRGVRLTAEGDQGFFGLVATNSTDQEEVVQFFAPERERYLEYDMTKLVHKLAVPKKLVIGIMSGLPIMGGQSRPQFPGQPPQQLPKWVIVSQIEEFFDVKTIDQRATEIPDDVDVLMLVQPHGLSSGAAYAIDQFALKGGRVMAFLDPVPDIGRMVAPASGGPLNKELKKLLDAWGVKFDAGKVAGDLSIARRVQTGGNPPVITEYISWLSVKGPLINTDDVISDGVAVINMASAGGISAADKATTKFVPLMQTTPTAMEIEAIRLSGPRPDPVALLREYKPGSKALVLAARVRGDIKTAFPGGQPKEVTDAKAELKAAHGGRDVLAEAKKAAAAKADKKAPAPKSENQLKSGKLNAVIVADSDMLYDEFWVQIREMLGQRISIPVAHNATFVINTLENLSGGEALSGLRGRGVDDRPFELVDDIRRDAERQFRRKEQTLVNRLNDLQANLTKVERQTKDGNVILSDDDRKAIEKFRGEMIATRKELRDVKHAMRADIDQLEGLLKFINIAGVPLLFGLGGIAFAAFQRRRSGGRA